MTSNLGTSNISELPYNNIALNSVEDGGNKIIENKIQNEIDNRNQQTQMINNNKTMQNIEEQNKNNMDYNMLINDIQKASQSGATTLPSRDIPMNTQVITQDEQIKPNFIPQSNNDYIGDNVIIDNTINQNNNIDNLESFYNTLQTPILLSILYFIFQLPIFKKYILLLIPSLFNKDGNQNVYGYLFYSILYGISYVILTFIINRLNIL